MKLKDIILEGPRSQSFNWRQGVTIDAQLRVIRDFLRGNPNKEVMNIYQQATRNNELSRQDIRTVQQIMHNYGVDDNAVRDLT